MWIMGKAKKKLLLLGKSEIGIIIEIKNIWNIHIFIALWFYYYYKYFIAFIIFDYIINVIL